MIRFKWRNNAWLPFLSLLMPPFFIPNSEITITFHTYNFFNHQPGLINCNSKETFNFFTRAFLILFYTFLTLKWIKGRCRYTLSEAWSGVNLMMAAQGAFVTDFSDRSTRTTVGTMLWTEYRPVIKIGPKCALGSHEIRPIHSAPSLGQSIV